MEKSSGELRQGWRVLLGAMLGMGAGIALFGQLQGFFMKPLQAEFGWTRGQVSLASMAGVLTALAMPVVGVLVDRYGPRLFILVGTALFVAAYAALALMPGQFSAFLLIIAFVGLAAGPAASPLVVTRPLVDAFDRSRGLALALGMSGSTLITAPILPILERVIAHYGWRAGYWLLAPVTIIAGLGAFALLRPHGPLKARRAQDEAGGAAGHSLREAVEDARFWLLGGSIACNCMISGAFAVHQQPLLGDLSVPGPTAAWLGAWFACAIVIGRLVAGGLLDGPRPTLVATVGLCGPVIGLLLFLPPSPSLGVLFAGTTLVGLSMGAEGSVLAFFVARYFGLRSFGAIYGLLGLVFGVSFAAGAILTGVLFDHLGSYHLALATGSGLAAVSAVLMLAAGALETSRRLPSPAPAGE